jgi:hypothetical protein
MVNSAIVTNLLCSEQIVELVEGLGMDVSDTLKLARALRATGRRSTSYSFSGAADLALCLGRDKDGEWEVFYFERGEKTFSKRFSYENEACVYMFDLLMRDLASFL